MSEIKGDKVRLGISAPGDMKICRTELYLTMENNKEASDKVDLLKVFQLSRNLKALAQEDEKEVREEKMEVLEQMRMLLREKAILFGQYEQETLRLDTDDLDAVDDIVDAVQHGSLIDKINGLDRRIAAIGESSAYGARCFILGKSVRLCRPY